MIHSSIFAIAKYSFMTFICVPAQPFHMAHKKTHGDKSQKRKTRSGFAPIIMQKA